LVQKQFFSKECEEMIITDNDMSSFGSLLKSFRKRRHLSQQQLAEAIGVHRSAITRWEQGDFLPESKALVLELARHLHLDNQESRQLLESSLTALAPYWMIPLPRNPFFTGREEMLSMLHSQLGLDRSVALIQSTAIHGLGGIGKTQIALEYAYQYALEYSAVFWIEAETVESIVSSLLRVADVLQLPGRDDKDSQRIISSVQRWLSTHSQWLVIWDNIEDLALLDRFRPSVRSGATLMTTRCQTLGTHAQGLALLPMEQDEGILFLLRRAKILAPEATYEQVHAMAAERPIEYAATAEMVTNLGGLPLALDQAGAYLEATQCGLPAYLELFRTRRGDLLQQRGDGVREHPASVSTTFALAITATAQRHPAVWDLLRVCAMLYPEAIPEELFLLGKEHLGASLVAVCHDPMEWNRIVAIACAYSLLSRQPGEQTLSIHRLVQAVLLDTMTEIDKAQWNRRTIDALDMIFIEVLPVTEQELLGQCERLLPHALNCIYRAVATENTLSLASLAYKVAQYLRMRGQYAEAELLYQHALRIREYVLGLDHPDVARVLNNLAILYWSQGKYAEAEPLYQRALHIRERVLVPGHPDLASSLNNLALLYWSQGKYAEAEPLYQRTLHIREQAQGPDHPDLASSINNLAALYWDQGKYAQSEQLYQRALLILEKALGLDHPVVAHTLNNLGLLYYDQGKYREAEPLYQRTLLILEQTQGSNHPDLAQALNNLAALYYSQGKYPESESLFQRALQIREQDQESWHPELANSLNGLANLYREQRKYAESESLYQRAFSLREQHLGPHHPETAQTLHDLAIFRQRQGNPREALSLAERTLSIRLQALGDGHPKTIATRKLYAQLLLEQIDTQEESISEESADVLTGSRGEEKTSLSTYSEDDSFQRFLSDCCELHPRASCRSADLWNAYERWVEEHQERYPLSRKAFIANLKVYGCRADRTVTARIWRGIAIVQKEL
jgi:tetratricopeptide (TPR) repeat protein